MSLTLALNNALSGLNVNQAAMSVISHNIANANTEGYSRQVVDQSAQLLNGVGAGVRIDDISRKIDKYLERAIQREISNVDELDRVADYYQRIQILLGEPGSTNSIDEYVEGFFDSLQALAESPDRVSFQSTVVNVAESLAREMSGLAFALEDLRYQADQDIQEAVRVVNNELAHLDSLNIAINRAAALNTSTAGLLDERDMALEKISGYLDIEVYFNENGAVNVFAGNGIGLVDDEAHELYYRQATGVDSFINDVAMNPLQVLTIDEDGNQIRDPENLISTGVEYDINSLLDGGSIQGLHQIRDVLIPDILQQLDMLAARLRDEVNAIHNDGSGYPAAEELSGTRLVQANEAFDWSGSVMIAALNPDGTAAYSTYADESYTGYRPLVLDLTTLDGGSGPGTPTTQAIIDEINNHFNAPPVKAELNNLNNIQLVSNQLTLPTGAPPSFTFDLDLENISATDGSFWVTNVQVQDDTAAVIASSGAGTVTDTIPRIALNPVGTYNFTAGSDVVTIAAPNHGLTVGERVYLGDPGGLPANFPISGVPTANVINQYFEVTGVSSSGTFEIRMASAAPAGGADDAGAAVDALPEYHNVAAGEKQRTRDSGTMTADLSANLASAYFDITVTVGSYDNVDDATANANVQIATLTYRVYNNTTYLLNDRYDIQSVTGAAQRVFADTPHQYVLAELVDENGNVLPSTNGDYGGQEGYLRLRSNPLNQNDFTIAIDELDSQQLGKLNISPAEEGTERGFSHYYELNNFFTSNRPTDTGDQISGSAINFAVEERLLDNPSLVSTGDLQRSLQPTDPDDTPLYTFERFISDNSVVQRLAELGFSSIQFDAAGGIPDNNLTFIGYTGEILGYIATQTVSAENRLLDNESLLEGFVARADAISGVNLDEELANTVIYQNAYTASARVITVTDELFEELLNSI